MNNQNLLEMKFLNTTTVEVRKKAFKFNSIDLSRILSWTILISITALLFYSSLYLWGILVLLVSYGAIRVYNWFKELIDLDLTIDTSDLTMEDIMADLERE